MITSYLQLPDIYNAIEDEVEGLYDVQQNLEEIYLTIHTLDLAQQYAEDRDPDECINVNRLTKIYTDIIDKLQSLKDAEVNTKEVENMVYKLYALGHQAVSAIVYIANYTKTAEALLAKANYELKLLEEKNPMDNIKGLFNESENI